MHAAYTRKEVSMNKSQELQQLSEHAEGLMSKVASDHSPQVQELRSRVSDTIKSAKDSIAKADGAAMDVLRSAASSADDYVRENPWVAIGVIAGVAASLGFLAGYLAAPQRSLMGMIRR
jgi:ElaB/YqjD/DUF883 family membrane-anchored ribosome-binding protein